MPDGPPLVDDVIGLDVLRGVIELEPADFWRDFRTRGDLALARPQQIPRLVVLVAARAFFISPAVAAVPDPPDTPTFSDFAHGVRVERRRILSSSRLPRLDGVIQIATI